MAKSLITMGMKPVDEGVASFANVQCAVALSTDDIRHGHWRPLPNLTFEEASTTTSRYKLNAICFDVITTNGSTMYLIGCWRNAIRKKPRLPMPIY